MSTYSTMIADAKSAISLSSKQSSIYIGCDSIVYKKNNRWMAKYSTVIVLHKDSKHGCQIFHTSIDMEDFKNLKQRLLNEVNFATMAATDILDVLDGRFLSIHLDINSDPNHKSNVAVKEAVGWVMGMFGFKPEIKPAAWAASHAADYAVRNLH